MIIAIDGNEANIKNRVGVNQFAFEVIWSIYQKTKAQKQKDQFLIFLKNQPRKDLPKQQSWWRYEVFGPKNLWTIFALSKRLIFGQPRPDVLYSPSHYGPILPIVPNIISIMDLGFLSWPNQFTKKDFFQLKYLTRLSVLTADKIIAISEFTKKNIISRYQISPGKITVAYPGWQKSRIKSKTYSQKDINQVKEKFGIKKEYLIYLGTLKPSKNVEKLIEAFSILKKKNQFKRLQLVIAGKKGWLYQTIFEKVKLLDSSQDIVFTGFILDFEAKILIANAQCFVLPSLFEGFGIPVLEAMAANTPVACANAGSLPEVVGKAALIFNPNDPADIAQAIEKILLNKSLRAKLIKAGQKRVKLFNWEECSRIILNTIKETAK